MIRIAAIIPARGGSKGIPHKNIIDFCGKPLLAWTIEHALHSKFVDEVFVSTDDINIAEVVINFGAKIVNRPAKFSSDDASSECAIKHVIENNNLFNWDYIVFLQPTSPLRQPSDIDNAIRKIKLEQADSLFSASYVSNFNIWRSKDGVSFLPCYDFKNRLRRQDSETQFGKQYIENGSLYVFKPKPFFISENRLFGKISMSLMESWKSFEIDDYESLELCKMLFQLNKNEMIENETPLREKIRIFD